LKKIDIRSYQSSLYESVNLFGMACTNSLEHLILPDSNLSEADNDYLADAIVSKVFKISFLNFVSIMNGLLNKILILVAFNSDND
jgi:hypothetical protein